VTYRTGIGARELGIAIDRGRRAEHNILKDMLTDPLLNSYSKLLSNERRYIRTVSRYSVEYSETT
jgi:hypothetical protein